VRHTTDELVDIAHAHYPRGLATWDAGYMESEETKRLSAARRQAGANRQPWRGLLSRLGAQFPGCAVLDRSLHLPTGSMDAGYSGALDLPRRGRKEYGHGLTFLVSFIAPYYFICSHRVVDDPEKLAQLAREQTFEFVNGVEVPPAVTMRRLKKRARRSEISFDFSADERPCSEWLARDIEATFGCERMPPEVGNIIVPDVSTDGRNIGEARLYDCLFSDRW
jgi:hypothetical protein